MTEVPVFGGLPVVRPAPVLCSSRGSQGLTLMSDLHLGSSQVDYALIEQELKRARRNGDRILLGGDVFDLILPGDKRYDPSKVHPAIRGRDDGVNAAVEWAETLLIPYVGIIDAVGLGNHETAVRKKSGVDAVRLLVERLNSRRGAKFVPIAQMGYTAFVVYRLRDAEDTRGVGRYVVWYTHGAGKNTSATGSLKTLINKAAVFSADLYWSGHSHARAHSAEMVIQAGRGGRPVAKDVRCVVTGSYMNPYGAQSERSIVRRGVKGNYASEAALSPHGLGGARVVLRWGVSDAISSVEVIQ